MRAAASQMSVSFHGWACTTKARYEGAQPPGAALLDPRPSTCCCRGAAIKTHLIIYPAGCAGSPCMIHCCNALVGNRMKQLQEERRSLIWIGAALSNLVQQWVLHRNSSKVCFITCIDLQTMTTSVSHAHAQTDLCVLMVEQGHRQLGTLSHDVAGKKHRRANACAHVHPRRQSVI